MYYIVSFGASIWIYHLLQRLQKYFCDLPPELKFNKGWKIQNERRTVIETCKAWQKKKKKKSFEKREFFLRSLTWNVDSKQCQTNEVAVKVIFIVKV